MATGVGPAAERYVALGAHLVGSVPLAGAEEVFRTLSAGLGDRLRRLPDGETGPRADWIVWQYPVLSSRPEFEVAPPSPQSYRALPRLRLGTDRGELAFGSLGYAEAAAGSYRTFSLLKRDGVVPRGCRFQVCLPTPLAPVSAFVASGDQATVEAAYEAAMADELRSILADIPHEQLAIQWDTNVEFGMLSGDIPAWFADVEAGIVERLLRLGRLVPSGVELGYHFCLGHDEASPRHVPPDCGRMVDVANALAQGLDRPLNWVHMPVPSAADGPAFVGPLEGLRVEADTELYLGILQLDGSSDPPHAAVRAAHALVGELGVATPCGWGRFPASQVPELVALHREACRPVSRPGRAYDFSWPEGFERIPDEDWVAQPVDAFGLHYDTVENHGWYRNLDLTVEQLAGDLDEGEILVDYSGGTGILADRLRLRIFDRQIGIVIADSSPKFLRVALDRFRGDERFAFRRLHYLKGERRLQYLDEVLHLRADVLASTNAIHLYDELEATLAGWARTLKPGGRARINSGNLRNPHAAEDEWIIDETVYVVHEVAVGLVRTDPRFAGYRAVLDDPERMQRYLEYRDRVFLAPRPLGLYVDALESSGFTVDEVTERTIEADVQEWYEFLAAYADAVLGWAGGSAKVDGEPASPEAEAGRRELLRASLDVIFGGRPSFRCCWTYISATRS
ncbi:MAG TPA: class I SAM-dependent methyltransferase [Gaiellaceae bacterium]|jgi:ubiquinone/menaquinone biosynthesis C-methylase UbiE|nr:class I SAM-dependent methyltransferase [Gaiellaceae bacterium]